MSKVEIIPAHLAVKAMRDNGYKNAAYAIAELMDNSIQAGARKVLAAPNQRPPRSNLCGRDGRSRRRRPGR